mgnify:CR=1 FL=1
MPNFKIEAITVSKSANFESCADKEHYFSQFSPLNISTYNLKARLGTISHEIIEKYLNNSKLKIDRKSVEKTFNEIVKEKKYDFDKEYLNRREGTEFIYRNLTVIKKLKAFIDENNFEISVEHDYGKTSPFYGKADIIFRTDQKSIVVDYKTGKIFNNENRLDDSINKQLLAYCFLELEEIGSNKDILAYVLNKSGDFVEIENCDKDYIYKYSERVKKLIDQINEKYTISDEKNFYCNECQTEWVGRISNS